jgi:hypothetical protein
VTRRLVSGIRPIAGMIAGKITEDYSGLALQNYQGLQAIAKKNGFKLEDILPPGVDGKPATAEETLKRLALGEIDPTRLTGCSQTCSRWTATICTRPTGPRY